MSVVHSPTTGTTGRAIKRVISAGGVSAAVGILCSLILLPLSLHYLGEGAFGVWATVASVLAVASLADGGLRTEIIRRVAGANGTGDDAELAKALHEAVTVLVVAVCAVSLTGIALAPVIRGFAFPHGAAGYPGSDVDLFLRLNFILVAANVIAGAHFAVLRGLQRADIESWVTTVATVVATLAAIVALESRLGIWALLLGSGVQLAVQCLGQRLLLHRIRPSIKFRLSLVDPARVRVLLGLSGLALLAQLSDVVDSQWDKVVISHWVGLRAVSAFQLGTTLVLQGKLLAVLPLVPLVTAAAELRNRDGNGVNEYFAILARGGAVLGAAILTTIYVFAPGVVRVWAGPDILASAGMARLFCVAVGLNLIAAPWAMRAIGEGLHRVAAAGAVTNIVVNAAASIALTINVGAKGALWGSIAGSGAGTAAFFWLLRGNVDFRLRAIPYRPWLLGVAVATVFLGTGVGQHANVVVLLALVGVLGASLLTIGGILEGLPIRSVIPSLRSIVSRDEQHG